MSSARLAAALSLGALLSACAAQTAPDDAAVCDAYRAGRSHVEVVAQGTVVRLLGVAPGRTSPHEGFLMRLDSACRVTVRVEANADFTGTFPLARGDRAVVKGEYEYYPIGGVIHWTHRDPRGRHEGGFVQVGGRTYD
ncbi:MAG TPA: DUF3465 domain-containing protein [Candidatus Tumulicola sp.]|nr:DUF3465 domain-containing protein [Candidatus Tumulicola sp.]